MRVKAPARPVEAPGQHNPSPYKLVGPQLTSLTLPLILCGPESLNLRPPSPPPPRAASAPPQSQPSAPPRPDTPPAPTLTASGRPQRKRKPTAAAAAAAEEASAAQAAAASQASRPARRRRPDADAATQPKATTPVLAPGGLPPRPVSHATLPVATLPGGVRSVGPWDFPRVRAFALCLASYDDLALLRGAAPAPGARIPHRLSPLTPSRAAAGPESEARQPAARPAPSTQVQRSGGASAQASSQAPSRPGSRQSSRATTPQPAAGSAAQAGAAAGIRGARARGGAASPAPSPPSAPGLAAPAPPQNCWNPGMEVVCGMTYVQPGVALAAAPPPPLTAGVPLRWRLGAASLPEAEPPAPERDPLARTLGLLRATARRAGRLTPRELAGGAGAGQRACLEALQRVHVARDGRRLARGPAAAVRRSARARRDPRAASRAHGAAATASDDDGEGGRARAGMTPADETDTRLGPECQVVVPPLRPRPAGGAGAGELRWLAGRVDVPVGATRDAGGVEDAAAPSMSPEARRAWIAAARDSLASRLGGEAAAALGLDRMGAALCPSFTPAEEAAVAEGMRALGRDFHAICARFLPHRAAGDLAAYYYNVLKIGASPAARAWLDEQHEAAAAQQAEAEAAEREREAEAARRAERQEAANKKRMLREAAAWVRAAGRAPAEANFNKCAGLGGGPVFGARGVQSLAAACTASATPFLPFPKLQTSRPVVKERALRTARVLHALDAAGIPDDALPAPLRAAATPRTLLGCKLVAPDPRPAQLAPVCF
uniref:ELM2 domain-containing protein n=1 Tax=Auxenochlorella protothecoides TaxID=3075 RepID=A0A1D2A7I6_AUXPR